MKFYAWYSTLCGLPYYKVTYGCQARGKIVFCCYSLASSRYNRLTGKPITL